MAPHHSAAPAPRTFPVVLAGFSAFLDLYATQPLLPMLARAFHASHFAVSLTVTAPTLAVAAAAPAAGRLGDRFGMRRLIVLSAFALAGATLLAATAHGLRTLIGWRLLQGLVSPGVFSIAVAYIHEEWPPERTGRATSAFVGGTIVGGFVGRALLAVAASDSSWQRGFLLLGALNLASALVIAWRLPPDPPRRGAHAGEPGAWAAHTTNRRLVATYATGFCILCAQVAAFTYVTFRLAGPPFHLSTAAIGWIFATYLVGAVVTPLAGVWLDRHGRRRSFLAAVSIGVLAVLLTLTPSLPVLLVGLSIFATAVFVTQAAATSHVGATAEHDRGLALGLYATCYYVGGSVGSSLPAWFWSAGGWPACVAFIVGVQIVMMLIAGWLW